MQAQMKFNPTTKKLFTDSNVFIKKLHCPRGVQWDELHAAGPQQRHCAFCEKNVVDIQGREDEAVLLLAQQDKHVCFKLDINDTNIQVINHNVE